LKERPLHLVFILLNMNLRKLAFILFLGGVCLFFQTCRQDVPVVDIPGSAYPNDIGKIVLTQCAISGCHNTQSKDACASLDMSSWNNMFQGSRNGNAVVIPYTHDFSTCFLFSNIYPDLGINVPPRMPLTGNALTHDQEVTLRNWIDNGAPDRTGYVKFSDNTSRKKFYVVNQGCDVVTVFDEQTLLPMRYVYIGGHSTLDSPHMVRVSPDGKYWYVSFLHYPYLQRYNTSDDSYAGQVYIGDDSFNTFIISSDSQKAFCVGYDFGYISRVNLTNMTLIDTTLGIATTMHGSMLNASNSLLYTTCSFGNFIVKLNPNDFSTYQYQTLDGSTLPITSSDLDPHDIIMAPDGSKYFVSCQHSAEVRIMQPRPLGQRDSLLHVVSLPANSLPQEFGLSPSRNMIFVTCTEDVVSFPGNRGSVYAIDLNTFIATPIFVGFQPHGIAVDDANGLVYVANRNVNPTGPAPHHTTVCGGRNGYVTIIDMNTLKILPNKKIELASDPYSVAVRH
jgi:DNA-binding beta-propeller fold protein YncE